MLKIIEYPEKKSWKNLLTRPAQDTDAVFPQTELVLKEIKDRGDKAVLGFTEKFDKISLNKIEVDREEIDRAESKVNPGLKRAIDLAIENITKFHSNQIVYHKKIETQPGVSCWQKSVPIEKVGLYIPGGTAPLFSTVLMLAIPAKIAGCNEIILCTPPDKDGSVNPVILYAAKVTGVNRVFRIGGIQAIGAMAYGTESVPKVYKIFGPGNRYVTAAKQIVSRGDVAIDMPAGPSEVAVMADESSNPSFIASDLLSQAEHGPDSQVILVTDRKEIIGEVQKELSLQLDKLPRKDFASKALEHSKIFLMNNRDEMVEIINEYAPEHLIIATQDADFIAERIINAGSVFIGNYTPESAGDYASGTNHTLPTYGYAKAYNGVNLDDYIKKITYQKITREGIENIGPAIEIMAEAEELDAHKNAIQVRLNFIRKNEKD